MTDNLIAIDCTPIVEKYDKDTITNICAWALVTLHNNQESKWYRRLNPFRHFYPDDYMFLLKALEGQEK